MHPWLSITPGGFDPLGYMRPGPFTWARQERKPRTSNGTVNIAVITIHSGGVRVPEHRAQPQGGHRDDGVIEQVAGDGEGSTGQEAMARGQGGGAPGHGVDPEGDHHQGEGAGPGAAEMGGAAGHGDLQGGAEPAQGGGVAGPGGQQPEDRFKGQGQEEVRNQVEPGGQGPGQALGLGQQDPGGDAAAHGQQEEQQDGKHGSGLGTASG